MVNRLLQALCSLEEVEALAKERFQEILLRLERVITAPT